YENFSQMTNEELYSKYRVGHEWGNYHPNDLQMWYDPTGIKLSDHGIKFSITQNTLTVDSYMIDGLLCYNLPEKTIPYGIGIISSKNVYKCGIFEWNIKLPRGAALWPAVWLSAQDSWPPEIDI